MKNTGFPRDPLWSQFFAWVPHGSCKASAFEEPVLKNTDTFQEPLPVDQYNEGGIGPY